MTKTSPFIAICLFALGISTASCGATDEDTAEDPIGRTSQAVQGAPPERLWVSSKVFIGQSPEQTPSPVIHCPMYSPEGSHVDAVHTLDVSGIANGVVRATISWRHEEIEPTFNLSVAAQVAQGSDGAQYLLVGAEGELPAGSQGSGFEHFDRMIVRCKYKITFDAQGQMQLVSCIDCVVILVRD